MNTSDAQGRSRVHLRELPSKRDPVMEPNGDSNSLNNFDRQLKNMRDVISSLIDLTMAERETNRLRHIEFMELARIQLEETRELLTLQREHRIDIMALFEVGKANRERLDKLDAAT